MTSCTNVNPINTKKVIDNNEIVGTGANIKKWYVKGRERFGKGKWWFERGL